MAVSVLAEKKSRRAKSLSVENLESRLNLSGLSGLLNPPEISLNPGAVQPFSAVAQLQSPSNKPISLQNLSGQPGFVGATAVNGSTSINMSDTSALHGMSTGQSNGQPVLGGVQYAGAYGEYQLNVSAAGTYALNFNVSSMSYSRMDVLLDGQKITTAAWNSTGSWSSYTTQSTTLNLSNGSHTLRFASPYNDKFNVQNAQLISTSAPVSNTTTVGSGSTLVPVSSYTKLQGVVQGTSNGQPVIGGVAYAGAYAEYGINVSSSGAYRVDLSTSGYGGTTDILIDGAKVGTVSLASTGSWSTYSWSGANLNLTAGQHTLRVQSTYGSTYNLQQIKLTGSGQQQSSDPSNTNLGSQTTAVPVQSYSGINGMATATSNGQPVIGGVAYAGAYVQYAVNASSAGSYRLDLTTSGYGGSLDVLVNGAKQTTIGLASTGGWSSYGTNSTTISLAAGNNTVRIVSSNKTTYNLQQIKLTGNGQQQTSDPSVTNLGSQTTAVPVQSYSAIGGMNTGTSNGQPVVGGVAYAGAYVEYSVNAASAGSYRVDVSTSGYGGKMGVMVNGKIQATIGLPSTGSWSNYATSSATVTLVAGTNAVRLVSTNGDAFNIQQVKLTASAPQAPSSDNPTSPPPVNNPTGSPVAITVRNLQSYNQLQIVGTSGNDSIYVTQSGSTLNVIANGQTRSYSNIQEIQIKGGDGNDVITVDSSVKINALIYGDGGNNQLNNYTQGQATIVSIGGGTDTLRGNGKNTNYWAGTEDSVNASSAEKNAGGVHIVSSFYGGVSTQLNGQNLPDPAGTGSTTNLSNRGFFGPNPSMYDVNQGSLNDCYVLAAVQSIAISNPAKLQTMAVDLGDGTYAVQFKRNGQTTYVRVDGDLPGSNGNTTFAHPGTSGTIWAPIMEKAYAMFRTGQNSYSSLDWGWSGDVFSDLGMSVTNFSPTLSADSFYNLVAPGLSQGKSVAISTRSTITGGAPIIASHAYSIDKVTRDGSGNVQVTLRNPWGMDGAGNDGNAGDGLIAVSWAQLSANFSLGAMAV